MFRLSLLSGICSYKRFDRTTSDVVTTLIFQEGSWAGYFCVLLVSGFCSILYEVIWLRLSMAQFGVTSAMVSIMLSMFMAGLGLGSWIVVARQEGRGERISGPALRVTPWWSWRSVSAMVVPYQLRRGEGCWIGSRCLPRRHTTWCRESG